MKEAPVRRLFLFRLFCKGVVTLQKAFERRGRGVRGGRNALF